MVGLSALGWSTSEQLLGCNRQEEGLQSEVEELSGRVRPAPRSEQWKCWTTDVGRDLHRFREGEVEAPRGALLLADVRGEAASLGLCQKVSFCVTLLCQKVGVLRRMLGRGPVRPPGTGASRAGGAAEQRLASPVAVPGSKAVLLPHSGWKSCSV